MNKLKQTPLNNLHRQLGAKITAFANYQMPVSYPAGIIQEHLHCRAKIGFFDISHMGQCIIEGNAAAAELEKLTPGGITLLKYGQQKYTVLTNPEGGIIDDIIVTRLESGVGIVVNAGCKEKDFNYLSLRLEDRMPLRILHDYALLALQGPGAAGLMEKLAPATAKLSFMHSCESTLNGLNCRISRSGYTGEDGFEISLHQDHAESLALALLAEAEVKPIGLGARDTLRLEAGLCLYGHELDETISPVEARLQWLIKKDHQDFPGAGKIREQINNGVDRLRSGLLVEGRIPVREDALIYDENELVIGRVTSGGFSPSLNRPLAMALLHPSHAKIGKTLSARVRDKLITVRVCRLPFIPHRYHG